MKQDWSTIAKTIDHALLNPTLTTIELEEGIRMAMQYDVASVCILPFYTRRCSEILQGSQVKTSTTIGFPHGGHATSVKIAEAKQAIEDGAQELDMVVNINQVLSEHWDFVFEEIGSLTRLIHSKNAKLKVIFENCYLTNDHKVRLCRICADAGADWVKTSTGFGTKGATIEDVQLMRKHSPANIGVKAAGAIRDLKTLQAFRTAGASRIGCSQTVGIYEQFQKLG